ncbi:protein-L-isoaspartate(D-aspartate) O-methyltransferase [candidate division KSB1 bacterium]|nr:protein-L-isoaspartate(D-aspartate) O-methyltransferase [candidate division KSB1 bacterium]
MNSQNKKSRDAGHSDTWQQQRERMVKTQIIRRGVKDPRVLAALRRVPRHKFVPVNEQKSAYEDSPLPIGYHQTISQPYIVAYMTEALQLTGEDKVLEIGTGSGYQAAVLAECARQVVTIEIVEPLCDRARKLLEDMDYKNITVYCRDGYSGCAELAPFDRIILTAAPPEIPEPLLDQLNTGGILIAPVGVYYQELVLLQKNDDGSLSRKKLIPVRFVPMTGKVQK